MSKKAIEKTLVAALLHGGHLTRALFEYELAEHAEEWTRSKAEDDEDYLVAVTGLDGDVAMMLIDEDDKVHVNGNARALLMKLWHAAYERNMRLLIPQMASELDEGRFFVAGVSVTGKSRAARASHVRTR